MIFATNGAKLYIGGVLGWKATDFVEADFTSQTWVEIGETESLGSLGDTASEITFDGIATKRQRRLKGTRSAGTMEVVCGVDYEDDGQIALIAAEKTAHNFAFKLEFNDAPVGGTPSQRLFIATVASAAEALDTANSVMKLNSSLWVNSNIVRINAAEGV
ncbi:hypothetical protein FAZ78_00370 [Cereibacter changlensis]|uniref:Phage tail protein n=1 Tax=Cereibacter changlensis TaxID=402884 RepID=A0A4V6WLS7_9RHOB|nr:hypothetical protein [Cereibacter changlensis]TKA98547.1 hypothetical protein FAZ78_00370 [Cereibacter changlensis]